MRFLFSTAMSCLLSKTKSKSLSVREDGKASAVPPQLRALLAGLVELAGFEPATPTLPVWCAPTAPQPRCSPLEHALTGVTPAKASGRTPFAPAAPGRV